ncbi:thiamine phosphate synthase [Macrococcus armenti]|uniref:thiamine phosphate synthase n=1 Tax=Macrococcus armenti TaxID=2875764 RepID=UPI001CCD2A2C|nr:thiamine phosphate synthase [Macrococcus armenti]UBH08716.1 thiamine phosphate synthase [Macrococcus armenti]UBH11014.1 thiamine phosphate synthase [Macrococcus armenti]UBH15491.1 thiamine phosphate synthase [Macrococcus armenti]UBH17851.1 thiamine phosphate synthase [Macrococcus armenti]UBH20116.1 thiamine phosphate synthase [Macrococcus armenti]
MIYMITPFVSPNHSVLQSIIDVEASIDGVILRLDANDDEIDEFINALKQSIDVSKIIVHNAPHLLDKHQLKRIHFKERIDDALLFKRQHPEISVGMSAHSIQSVRRINGILDYCIFGHVFPTTSKQGLPPQRESVIQEVLNYDIPVIAIGGIDENTIHDLNIKFSGLSGIRLFQHKAVLEHVIKEWLLRNSTSL